MRKLEKLKVERSVARMLTFLPKSTQGVIDRFYESAICGIENYGLDNEAVSPESLREIKRTVDSYFESEVENADQKAK